LSLTNKKIRDAKPDTQNRIIWDTEVKGLGLGPISASAAICWVAGQKIRDWYELIEAGSQIREALQTLNTPADAFSVAERSSATCATNGFSTARADLLSQRSVAGFVHNSNLELFPRADCFHRIS
jgi:hypothetical protein